MKFGIRSLLAAVIVLSAAIHAQAVVIANWNFDTYTTGNTVNGAGSSYATGTPLFTANPIDSKTTFGPLNPGYSGTSVEFAESNPGHNMGGNFVLTLQAAQSLSALQISYYTRTTSTTPGQTWEYSLNNGTTWTSIGTVTATGTFAQYSFSISGLQVNSGSTVLFRDTFSGGTGTSVDFDNIQISASPVPEPMNYALVAFGLVFIGGGAGRFYFRRMNRKAEVA